MENIKSTNLSYDLAFPREIDSIDRRAMHELMMGSYCDVTREGFESDLDRKQLAAILRSADGKVRGFTTLALNPGGYRASDHDILYSGDTIIDPAYWGSLEMMRGFTTGVGRILGGLGGRRLFWLLTSKGHRTYMLMAQFCKVFYPSYVEGESEDLRAIARQCGRLLYPNHWSEEKGVLTFSGKNGPLKRGLVQGTYDRVKNPHVQFFLATNPGFGEGDELLCVAELHPENARRSAREFMLAGIQNPIVMTD
jgi:hypothetical protein